MGLVQLLIANGLALTDLTYYVESKFGTSGLTKAQRVARDTLGDLYSVEKWDYDWVSSVGSTIGNSLGIGTSSTVDGVGGGFVLYPNKSNTNIMQSVYSK